MTLRTKSRAQQWTVWLCASVALLAVYVILSRLLNNSAGADVFAPRQHRLMMPLLVLLGYVVKETRWDGISRGQEGEKVKAERQEEVEKAGGGGQRNEEKLKLRVEVEERNLTSYAAAPPVQNELGATRHVHCPPPPLFSTSSSLTGEELFAEARALSHQVIPDFDADGPYLDLLGQSAAEGYAPALAKLGEYAMRRAAWVEAYYWMAMAKRQGMQNLATVMREIRRNWSLGGFPDQSSNVNRLFSEEAGSLGRALLHLDSGHEAANARAFLREHYPEFL